MKKKIKFFLLCLVSLFVIPGCSLDEEKPETKFIKYNEFVQNKQDWVEPDNYDFKYDGRTYGPRMVYKIIKRGDESIVLSDNPDANFTFKTMLDIYEYVEEKYDFYKKHNKNYVLEFLIDYIAVEDYGKCISTFEIRVKNIVKGTEANGAFPSIQMNVISFDVVD